MKKFFKFAAIVAATAALFSCQEKPEPTPDQEQPGKTELNENIKFTIKCTDLTENTAKFKVTHDGATTDTWHYFTTTESNISDAIEAEVAALTESGKSLQKSTSKNLTVRGLEPQTEYTFVVFGVTIDGVVYGEPATAKFTTTRDPNVMEQTSDWEITYERGTYEGEVAEIFSIDCAEGDGYYFTTIDKNTLEANELTVVDYVNYVINTEIPAYLDYGYKWADLYVPGPYNLASPRMISDDYVALAIGFDAEGEATGRFSAQDFTVVEETATAEYNQWLGDWDVTDTYQYEDEETGEIVTATATYTVTLHHYDNNFMYAMTGWETNGDISNNIVDYVGEYAVPVYYNNGKLSFEEVTLDYVDFGEVGTYSFGFYGIGNLTYNGQSYEETLLGFDGVEMASATTEDGGKTGVITGNKGKVSGYEVEYLGMFYCGYPASGSGDLAYWNYPMYFPLAMTKVETAATKAAMNEVSLSTTDLKVKTARKIEKKNNFTPMYVK